METISIDTDTIVQLGVGFAIAYVVLRLVLDFLKPVLEKQFGISNASGECAKLRADLEEAKKEMLIAKQQVKELHEWHNARTEDGGFRWYVPSTLERAIESLSQNIAKQSSVLADVASFQRDTCKFMERLERRLEKEA